MSWLRYILDILFPPRNTELVVRNCASEKILALLSPEVFTTGDFSIVTLLPYEEIVVQSCILEAKFHGNKKAQHLLSEVLSEYLPELVGEIESYGRTVSIIALPLSKKRLRSRGYNQIEEIVRMSLLDSGLLGRLQNNILHRTRDTRAQTSLSGAERRKNMKDAFQATITREGARTEYIVIDDVSTTGATLAASHESLTQAGAKHITLISLAH